MIIFWILLALSLLGLIGMFYVSGRRLRGNTFECYERFLLKHDDTVRRLTFRAARKTATMRDICLRSIHKWGIVLLHLILEAIHFISAKINKMLARMKYKTRKKAREVHTGKPSEFLRKVKEEKDI